MNSSEKVLSGLSVCMLVSNDVSIDARVRKEAETLANAGAQVTVIGLGEEPPEDIVSNAPYRLILAQPSLKGKPLQPRWGMPDVWYPVRVLVNTTVTKYRQKRYAEKIDESGYVSQVSRQDMIEAAAPLNFDVIHAHDLDTLYAGNRIAQEKGALLVYDSHELFTELHFLHPLVKEQCAIVEEEVFPHIDALVTVSPLIGQRLREKYQRFDLEPVVLYNGGVVVMDKVQPVADPVRLFFQGAFAPDRNLLELALAMKGLQGKATLSLQGWGPDEEGLRAIIEEYSLEDIVEIIPPCPPFDVVPSAARFDVGVINSIPEDENFLVTLPNKLFDYMSAGLAVASTDLPPIKEILTKEECGITYEQKGAEHTAEVLGNLVGNPEKILQMKKASLAAAPKYAWKAQAEKLIALYVDLRKEIDDERATRQ